MNFHNNPHWIVVDIEPSIALARAECSRNYRALPAPNAAAPDVIKDAPAPGALHQRDWLRQLMTFLVSGLRFRRSSRHDGLSYPSDLQPSLSASSPRGA